MSCMRKYLVRFILIDGRAYEMIFYAMSSTKLSEAISQLQRMPMGIYKLTRGEISSYLIERKEIHLIA